MGYEFGEGTQGKILGDIEKNEDERLRVSIQVFKEHPGIDIRIVERRGKNWCFTQKGIRLPLGRLDELLDLLGEAKGVAASMSKLQEARKANYRYRGSGRANPRSKGTNPRATGAAPRQKWEEDPFDDEMIA